jgi:putative sterol carrier protein
MARFLSPEWVAALNHALEGVVVDGPGPAAGLAAVGGRFTVAQEVRGTPAGDVRLHLRVEDGSLHFMLSGLTDEVPIGQEGSVETADVTVTLSYEDAAALSKGELAPAEALNAGKIRVRGDLSVLVASQSMLESARSFTASVVTATTY